MPSGGYRVSVSFQKRENDVTHECETKFGVFPVTDVIDTRKRKYIA